MKRLSAAASDRQHNVLTATRGHQTTPAGLSEKHDVFHSTQLLKSTGSFGAVTPLTAPSLFPSGSGSVNLKVLNTFFGMFQCKNSETLD